MGMMTTTTLSAEYQTYFSDKLLERAMQLTVLDQFATKVPFPAEKGAKTIQFFRKQAGAASNVQALSEGVPTSTYREVLFDTVTATLAQYGETFKMSDILQKTQLFDTLEESMDSAAEDAAYHADQIVRNVIQVGVTNTTSPANLRYVGATQTFAGLSALSASAGALQIADLLNAATALKLQRAPRKNGSYFALMPPQVSQDIMLDSKFVNATSYSNISQLQKGELGQWYGVRIVEMTLPFRETSGGTEGTFSSTGGIFSTYVVGTGAFATPIMGGQSPYNPHVYVNDKPDKSDPANQFTLVAWKAYWAALMTNALWAVIIKSKATFA